MNDSKRTPPDRVQVPAPSAALNVSGSQASNMVTTCCDAPFAASCAGVPATAGWAFVRGEGADGWAAFFSHPTKTAAAPTKTMSEFKRIDIAGAPSVGGTSKHGAPICD